MYSVELSFLGAKRPGNEKARYLLCTVLMRFAEFPSHSLADVTSEVNKSSAVVYTARRYYVNVLRVWTKLCLLSAKTFQNQRVFQNCEATKFDCRNLQWLKYVVL